MKKQICVVVFALLCTSLMAQDKSLYEKHWFIKKGDTLPYRLLLPENYDAKKNYPLILFLHGAGERGSDNEKQLVHGWWLFLVDSIRKKYRAIVVFPQCATNSFWSNVNFKFDTATRNTQFEFPEEGPPTTSMRLLLDLIDLLNENYKLDKDRMYVAGLSMGGMGTFELVRRKPKLFAAAIPICGGGNPASAKKMNNTAWWIFHGEVDAVVPVGLSKAMAEALKQAGADVKLTLYPGVDHNSWDSVFKENELFSWMFSHQNK